VGTLIDIRHLRAGNGASLDLEARVPFGTTVGPLTIGPRRPAGWRRLFRVRCECGAEEFLPVSEIMNRIEAGEGCEGEACCAGAYQGVLGGHEERALAIQLFFLTLFCPERVSSHWGGTLDDGESPTYEEAVQALLAHLKPVPGGPCWLALRNPSTPYYLPGNVQLVDQPWGPFKNIRNQRVKISGRMYSIKKLSKLARKPVSGVLEEIWQTGGLKIAENDREKANER
jgi:hypothetical protein